MKRRLAILLAISLAVSPLCAVPVRASEAAETGATLDPEIAAVIEPDTEAEEISGAAESVEIGATADPETAAETEPEEIVEPNEIVDPEEDVVIKDPKMSGVVTDFDDNGNVLHHYIDGEMIKGAWATIVINGKHYKFYFDANGNPLVGKKKVVNKIYYFADQNYPNILRGAMLTGFRKINGRTYYFGSDGVGKTGFQKINGKIYYFADSRYPKKAWGEMLKGHRYIGSNYYYFNDKGVMRTGWFKSSKGLMAFFGKNGKAGPAGWKKYDYRWFYIKKSGIARTGWLKDGSDIYYLDSKVGGRRLFGPSTVDGKKYFFDENGRRAKTKGWKNYKGNYYYTFENGRLAVNTTISGYRVNSIGKADLDSMDWKAQGYSSNTNYLILVNRSLHKVAIYRRSEGLWSPIKKWYCGDGKSSTPTIEGNFTVGIKMLYFDSGSARCWYATQFCGNYLFHSVLYYQNSWPASVMDGRVGVGVSHGCVRLQVDNAEWIYDNIPRVTKVIVYH